MTHEPECPQNHPGEVNAAVCACAVLRAAYRRGYNDHARSQQHWQDTHGAYRQHGEGENP